MRRLAARVIAVAALLAVAFGVADAVDPAAAVQLNAQAMQFAQQNMADQALPLFKLAVSTNPQSAEYWNNLGVCYMRLQRWDLAAAALTRGAAFGDAGAKANLAKVQSYLSAIGSAAAAVDIDAEVGLPSAGNSAPAKSEASSSGASKSAAGSSSGSSSGSGSSGSGSSGSSTPDGRPAPKFLPKPVYVKPDGLTVRPRRRVTRLTLEQLYAPENARFADGKEPYILTGAMEGWAARSKWSLEWFAAQFGASIVDFYPHNMAKHDTHPYLARMDESIAELRAPSGRYPHDPYSPGTYLQWNVQPADWERLLADTRLPYAFRRDEEWLHGVFDDALRAEYTKRVHWRMMLIGSKGAGMFVHMDVLQTSSWQAQVLGAKKWFLCSPTQSPYLYGAGKVDVFNPDYATYPLFAQSDCYEDVVSAGEMVYYPANYWHQTENLADVNVAFSSTIADDNNYHLVQNELKAECATGKYKWGFSKDLCAALDKLYAFWADRYEQRDRGSCSISERNSHAN